MSEPTPPLISVVIPTYQRAARLEALLRSLAHQTLTPADFEVIVADDASADGTAEMLGLIRDELPYRLVILRSPTNSGGPATVRNLGWRAAVAPLLAFVDDDCEVEPGWLEAGLRALEADGRLGVVQGRTRPPTGHDPAREPDWAYTIDVTGPTAHFEGCNLFFRREALAAAGGFPEDIGWWAEDAAAGWAVVGLGWERGFARAAVAVHEVARRGWRWHARWGLREANLVRVAGRYPAFRDEVFWRPWALRRSDAAFAAATAGALAGLRWRPALLAGLPYLWMRRGLVRTPRLGLQVAAVDAARTAGHLRGALLARIVVI